eukprot:40787-Prymnesium_polylepis.3
MLAVPSMTLGFQAPMAAPARVNARMASDDLKSLAKGLNPIIGYYDPLSAPRPAASGAPSHIRGEHLRLMRFVATVATSAHRPPDCGVVASTGRAAGCPPAVKGASHAAHFCARPLSCRPRGAQLLGSG